MSNVFMDTQVVPAKSDVDVLVDTAVNLVEAYEREWIAVENFVYTGGAISAQMLEEKKRHQEDSAEYLWLIDAELILVRKMGKVVNDVDDRRPLDLKAAELIAAFEAKAFPVSVFKSNARRLLSEISEHTKRLPQDTVEYSRGVNAAGRLNRALETLLSQIPTAEAHGFPCGTSMRLKMSKTTTKMLKDLLERLESGEIIMTDFDVSNDVEEGRLTGEQRFYITTQPVPEKPVEAVADLFGSSVDTFERMGERIKAFLDAIDKKVPCEAPEKVESSIGGTWRGNERAGNINSYGCFAKVGSKSPQDLPAVSHPLSERSRRAVAPVQELMHSVYQFANDCHAGEVPQEECTELRENYLARIRSAMDDYPPQSLRYAWLSATLIHLGASRNV